MVFDPKNDAEILVGVGVLPVLTPITLPMRPEVAYVRLEKNIDFLESDPEALSHSGWMWKIRQRVAMRQKEEEKDGDRDRGDESDGDEDIGMFFLVGERSRRRLLIWIVEGGNGDEALEREDEGKGETEEEEETKGKIRAWWKFGRSGKREEHEVVVPDDRECRVEAE